MFIYLILEIHCCIQLIRAFQTLRLFFKFQLFKNEHKNIPLLKTLIYNKNKINNTENIDTHQAI